jgi:release factor glutamine methyltransferase
MLPHTESTIVAVMKSAEKLISERVDQQTAAIDARLLLQFCLQKEHSYLLTWPQQQLSEVELGQFKKLLDRRLQGEPIAYITEHKEFWSLDLKVNKDTLIPRPETELLVELALQRVPKDEALTVLDMGTGCGAIALAIASERPQCQIWASDISADALNVAKHNARELRLSNIQFFQSDWGIDIPQNSFDLIVSNPPYIDPEDVHLKQGDLRFEPRQALAATAHGLADLETISQFSINHLKPNSWLLMEHGFEQHLAVTDLLANNSFKDIQNWQDIYGNFRVSGGMKVN